MSVSMPVGKEAGSQRFGFTRTTDTQGWKARAARVVHTTGQAGLLSDSGHLARAEQPRSFWLLLHLVQTCYQPSSLKTAKQN